MVLRQCSTAPLQDNVIGHKVAVCHEEAAVWHGANTGGLNCHKEGAVWHGTIAGWCDLSQGGSRVKRSSYCVSLQRPARQVETASYSCSAVAWGLMTN